MKRGNMNASRIIIDRPFTRAVWIVLEAFLAEGFVLKPVDISVPCFRTPHLRRSVVLKATYQDEALKRARLDRDIAVLVSIDETAESHAIVTSRTVTSWNGRHPALAAIAHRFQKHVEQALDAVPHRDASRADAA
jgi:hypothetical protein